MPLTATLTETITSSMILIKLVGRLIQTASYWLGKGGGLHWDFRETQPVTLQVRSHSFLFEEQCFLSLSGGLFEMKTKAHH